MRLLLICYRIAACQGSESGSGYNFACQIRKHVDELQIISRQDNIEALRSDPDLGGAILTGYDVPRALSFWKRGSRGVIPYYYLWQRGVGRLARRLHAQRSFDVVHQYNFHTDWAPHFLRFPDVRVVWGPICHQPFVPPSYCRAERAQGLPRETAKAAAKQFFWRFDPNLKRAIQATDVILYANRDVAPPFRGLASVSFQTFGGASFLDRYALPGAGETPGPLRLLHVGRSVSIKGPSVALEALAAALRMTAVPIRLTLVGGGPLRQPLETLSHRLGVREHVEFVPWLPQQELACQYGNADGLLYPSLANQDTVVAEGLAAGLVVIGVDQTGSAAMTAEAGLMSPRRPHAETVAGLARAIAMLAEEKRAHPDAFAQRRAAALHRSPALSWSATAADIAARYHE